MAKTGRNHLCPCGSGIKFKRCHGLQQVVPTIWQGDGEAIRESESRRVQRERQQGLGRPINSATIDGNRYVSIKNRFIVSKQWMTFHDFLMDYIKAALGGVWGNAELAKPPNERHPVIQWFVRSGEQMNAMVSRKGEVRSGPMTGAIAAYLHLAYDLYSLDHNAELQEKLLSRLRDHRNFPGAYYEVFVAATMIRAGFSIEFENEDDRTSSHCEFTATHLKSKRQFSVEAKTREGKDLRFGERLTKALRKNANHPRVVFMNANVEDERQVIDIPHLHATFGSLKRAEQRVRLGDPLPPAYVFVTNHPWSFSLESEVVRTSVIAAGFLIQEFNSDAVFATLRAQIDARERHIEMHDLLGSMREHSEVPATFDGEIPELAFGDQSQRLLIGHRYLIPDKDGNEIVGTLTSATVSEAEGLAHGAYTIENGSTVICSVPLTDLELIAWRKFPDTFFGGPIQNRGSVNSPLELYDFFLACYQKTSREQLLFLLKDAHDIHQLGQCDQPTLASIYAERCAVSAAADQFGQTSLAIGTDPDSPGLANQG